MGTEVTRESISRAARRIEDHIRRTPVLELGDALHVGYRLALKLDSLQPTGSFKVRGAFSLLTAGDVPEAGVVAASGGSFGLAIAHAARELGYRATVFVPESSPREKTRRIAASGARVELVPGYYAQALEASLEWVEETGALHAHAYDDPDVMSGQGTCGREIMEQVPDTASILVAVGGGGLIGGIASWARDEAQVIAVEPWSCQSLNAALKEGQPVDVEVGGVASSSLGAARIGGHPWRARHWIDDNVLVTDAEIVEAQRWVWEACRVLCEASAATPIAALLSGAYEPEAGTKVVALVSGANTDPAAIA